MAAVVARERTRSGGTEQGAGAWMVLNQPTLYVVLTIGGVANATVFAGLSRYAARMSGPMFWAAAAACTALAFGSAFVPIADWRVSSIVFNVPFAIGPVLLFAGLQRFYGNEPHDRLVQGLIAAAVVSTVAFTYLWPNTATRIATLSAVMVVGYAGGSIAAWREPRGPGRIVARLVALTFFANGIATAGRATFIALAPIQYAFATPELEGLNSVAWVMNLLVAAVSAPLLVLAVAIRLFASLQAEKRRAEASETQFREFANSAAVGIFVTDVDGRCTYANPRCAEIAGTADGAMLGMGWQTVFLPEDLPSVIAAWREAVHGEGETVYTFRVRRPTGEIRWLRSRPVVLPSSDNHRNRFLATVEDITEQRDSYERIRELAQRLETVREDERRSVAYTLHEGVAQDLVAATLDLNRLRAQVGGSAEISDAADAVARAIDKCIRDLRDLTNSLRPGTLAHLPLETAISQYVRQFAERSGLDIRMSDGTPLPKLNDAVRLVFFRALQEGLTNVARHARAGHVTVSLAAEPARLALTIDDDGVGITEQDRNKPHALGLLAIQERFAALGGGLEIRRRGPCGTSLSVFLPWPSG